MELSRMYEDYVSAFSLPFCIAIALIPMYLMIRAFRYLYSIGEDAAVKAQARKAITAYDTAIKNANDEKLKAKLESSRDQLKDYMEKYEITPNR